MKEPSKNQNLCVSCGEIMETEDIRLASNGKAVCFLCIEAYERKNQRVFSLEKKRTEKRIEEVMKRELLTPHADILPIDNTLLNLQLEDFVQALSYIPVPLKKEIYAMWLQDLIEINIKHAVGNQLIDASKILAFITADDDEFLEAFDEYWFWSAFHTDSFYRKHFIGVVYRTYKYHMIRANEIFNFPQS